MFDSTKIVMTADVEAKQTQDKVNAEARTYLASTDWYVIRLQETGVAIPADVLTARQTARDSIV